MGVVLEEERPGSGEWGMGGWEGKGLLTSALRLSPGPGTGLGALNRTNSRYLIYKVHILLS